MTQAKARILVTGGEEVGVLGALRALRAASYEPWAAIPHAGAYAARSRAVAGVVVVPDAGDRPAAFVERVRDASERIGARLVIPGTEAALVALASAADRFPASTTLALCPPSVVAQATDKTVLAEHASAAGLSVPPTSLLSVADVEGGAPGLRYPAVVKPVRSRVPVGDGRLLYVGAAEVWNESELRAALAALPDGHGLVQPFIEGILAALAGIRWNGDLLGPVHFVASRTWPPRCGTAAYAVTVPRDRELEEAAARLLASVGWTGLFQIQLVDTGADRFLIDLNPRIFTSLTLTTAAGTNLPALWADLLLGRARRASGYRAGVRYRHEENDVRALLAEARSGRLRSALAGALPRTRTVHAVASWRDPLPVLTSVEKLGRRLRR